MTENGSATSKVTDDAWVDCSCPALDGLFGCLLHRSGTGLDDTRVVVIGSAASGASRPTVDDPSACFRTRVTRQQMKNGS